MTNCSQKYIFEAWIEGYQEGFGDEEDYQTERSLTIADPFQRLPVIENQELATLVNTFFLKGPSEAYQEENDSIHIINPTTIQNFPILFCEKIEVNGVELSHLIPYLSGWDSMPFCDIDQSLLLGKYMIFRGNFDQFLWTLNRDTLDAFCFGARIINSFMTAHELGWVVFDHEGYPYPLGTQQLLEQTFFSHVSDHYFAHKKKHQKLQTVANINQELASIHTVCEELGADQTVLGQIDLTICLLSNFLVSKKGEGINEGTM